MILIGRSDLEDLHVGAFITAVWSFDLEAQATPRYRYSYHWNDIISRVKRHDVVSSLYIYLKCFHEKDAFFRIGYHHHDINSKLREKISR